MATGDEGEAVAGVDPIGRALRDTYPADNEDTLGRDLTGLMLQLARVEEQPRPPLPPVPTPPAPWFRRLLGR